MSEESPPTYTTSIFNQANFGTAAGGLDTAYLNSHYLKYPTAQTGLETIANLATTNNATINGLTVGRGSGNISSNTAFGINALAANTTGIENTAVGDGALELATTASQNTALGHETLYNTTTSGTSTAVGFHAARNATGARNLAIGYRAFRGVLGANAGNDNIAIGSDSVFNGGTRATGIGVEALYNGGGVDCVAVGYKALHENPGANNTGIGNQALNATAGSGTNNTGIGYAAGQTNISGSNNTYVGYNTLPSATNYSNSTALGSGATITASNQVVLGTTSETVIIPRITRFLTPPVIIRTGNATKNMTNNIDTIVEFQTLDSNSSGYTGLTYSSGTFTNSNSYSIGVNISALVVISANLANNRAAFISSGGVRYAQALSLSAGSTEPTVFSVSCNLVLTSGATFGIYGWQNSGSTLTLSTVASTYSTVSIMVF